jgi:tape measure domain-containing protein
MATISELNVRLGLLTRNFDKNLARTERSLRASGARMSRLGTDLTFAISAPLAAFGASAISAAGDLESLRLAMRATFEGAGRSIQQADAELEALRKSALAPGLDFEQAVRASVRLQNVGFTAETARATIEQLANAIATTGGTAQDLDEVTNQFSQMIGKGKIFQDDLKIIVGRMPILANLMKTTFGTTTAEGLNALGVDARTFVDTMVAKMQELPRVSGGIKNAIVNAGSALRNSLAAIGEEINRVFDLTALSESLATQLGGLVTWFVQLDDGTKKLIVQFGLVLIAAGPLLKVFGALYGGVGQLVGIFRTLATSALGVQSVFQKGVGLVGILIKFFAGMTQSTASVTGYIGQFSTAMLGAGSAAIRMRVAVIAATGGLAAILLGVAAAVYLLSSRFDAAQFATKQFNDAHRTTIEQTAKETAELNRNFDILKNVAAGKDEHKKAIAALQAAYPDYLKNIDLEKASSAELTQIQRGLNDQILRGVAERQKAAAVNAVYEKQAQILLRIQQIQRGAKTTVAESTLINTGDMIRAGGIAGAVVQKLQAQVRDLSTEANQTAQDFDKAFGLQARAIDPLLQAEYKAREAAEDERDALLGLSDASKTATQSTRIFTGATTAAGDGLTKKMRNALQGVNASIDAFEEKILLYGESAGTAEEKNDLLTKGIQRLLTAGFGAGSAEVQRLKSELDNSGLASDGALEKFRKLREFWSKPIDIKLPNAVPTLPQANPLGVQNPDEQASPVTTVSISAEVQGLESINALTASLQNMVATGLTPAQAMLEGLKNNTLTFQEAFSTMSEQISSDGTVMQQIALGLGTAFQQAADSGASSFAGFAQEFVRAATKIIKTQIQIAVTNAALSALESTPYPYNLILAGIAGAAAGALFQGLVNKITAPKLAQGGVITRPTFAMLGEYPGASTNPEIAAPESKLRSIFRSENAGGGTAVELYATIRGDDIFLSNRNAGRRRGRTT